MLYDKMDELGSVEIFPGCQYRDELQKALPYFCSGLIIDYLYDLFDRHGKDLEWKVQFEEPDDYGDYYCQRKIVNAIGQCICEECTADSDDPGFIGDWELHPRSRLLYIEKGQFEQDGRRDSYITLAEFMEDLALVALSMAHVFEGHR